MNNLDKQYQNLLQDILDNGIEKTDRTGTGTISVFGRTIRHDMKSGFPLLTTKKMAWKSMVVELLWFLKGDTNIKYLIDNNCHIWNGDAYKRYKQYANNLDEPDMTLHIEDINESKVRIMTESEFVDAIKTSPDFAKTWGELGPIYGKQWRNWTKFEYTQNTPDSTAYGNVYQIDQIANLINDLKTNPDSRRLMVNAWNVGELDQMVLPPCHYGFQLYTRPLSITEQETYSGIENAPKYAISLMWNQRSVDTPLGLPFNIASYGLLLEIIAKKVNMIPDELIGNLGDTHIYKNQIDGVKEQLSRTVMHNLPTLKISDKVVDDISEYEYSDFILENYQSQTKISFPLSN